MSAIYTTLLVTSAVAVSYIEASSEDMSVACADDTCVAMTVITDCIDKVEDGGANANANPYGNADDGADGGTRGSSNGNGGADGDTSKAISVVLASTPLPLRESHLGPQESGNMIR